MCNIHDQPLTQTLQSILKLACRVAVLFVTLDEQVSMHSLQNRWPLVGKFSNEYRADRQAQRSTSTSKTYGVLFAGTVRVGGVCLWERPVSDRCASADYMAMIVKSHFLNSFLNLEKPSVEWNGTFKQSNDFFIQSNDSLVWTGQLCWGPVVDFSFYKGIFGFYRNCVTKGPHFYPNQGHRLVCIAI